MNPVSKPIQKATATNLISPIPAYMQTRKTILLVLGCLLAFQIPVISQESYGKELRQAADGLYISFSKTQQMAGHLSFSDTARLQWNNLPVGLRARVGLSVGNMTDSQRVMMHRVLSISLSSQGYLKATGIMQLDDLLNRYFDTILQRKEINEDMYKRIMSLNWSPKNYFFAFFGKPTDPNWGYKLEGHHLSLNFTFVGNHVSVTPYFMGTDPAEYITTEYAGLRVLGQEEDLGLQLVRMLTPEQQQKATLDTAVPGDIITAAESGRRLVNYWGLRGADMTTAQRSVLQHIVREYVFNLEYEKAVAEWDKIQKAGMNEVYFGWIGAYEEQKPHYFIINGPTFLIEFDNNGGPRRRANHIHTIWREKGSEYGEDLLKKHYQVEKH
jgi:Protein of unknown function (DUF3500)